MLAEVHPELVSVAGFREPLERTELIGEALVVVGLVLVRHHRRQRVVGGAQPGKVETLRRAMSAIAHDRWPGDLQKIAHESLGDVDGVRIFDDEPQPVRIDGPVGQRGAGDEGGGMLGELPIRPNRAPEILRLDVRQGRRIDVDGRGEQRAFPRR